jgi:carboxyl-terminal processing protease
MTGILPPTNHSPRNSTRLPNTLRGMARYIGTLVCGLALNFAGPLPLRAADPDPVQLTLAVASIFEQIHYSKKRIDRQFSQKLLRNFLDNLDPNHSVFTREDIEDFTERWANDLDSEVVFGRTQAAEQIHAVFMRRVEAHATRVLKLLETPEAIPLETDRTMELDRRKLPWPPADALHQLWEDQTASDFIQERLNKTENPAAAIRKRYEEYRREVQGRTQEDAVRIFLLSLAQTYDPHSEYMGKLDQDQFTVSMRLSLFGIGATLRSEDGYTKVENLVPGGPASRSGKIQPGDRIVGVAQGSQEFVDCVGMRLDKVISMIRGDKDTVVRIKLLPVDATNASERRVVEMIRDEIKIKEGEAQGELLEWPRGDGSALKLGYIYLPSFYRDFAKAGSPEGKSTTKDVLTLLNRLKNEGIEGLIIDLRSDAGGSLEEAIQMTGLFIPEGPVVQIKNGNGEINVLGDTDPTLAYDGPLVVLLNRQSASASEIFAAALQDYGRALLVGDSKSYGKGTVQNLIELPRVIPILSQSKKAGSVKVTIQKFYRIAGGSTQLRGVQSDIVLPAASDRPEIGEEALKDPLPYDTIAPQQYRRWEKSIPVEALKARSQERVAQNVQFTYALEDLERIRSLNEKNSVSLSQKERLAELEKDEARSKKREAERSAQPRTQAPKAFRITLDNASAELQPIVYADPKAERKNAPAPKTGKPKTKNNENASPAPKDSKEQAAPTGPAPHRSPALGDDPVKEEGLKILADLIQSPANSR